MPDLIPKIRPEDSLLRLVSRRGLSAADNHFLRIKELLTSSLDWEYFLIRAQKERTAPLVYKFLPLIPAVQKAVPESIQQKFKEIYYSALTANAAIIPQLEEITEAFGRENIEVLIFKGIALAGLAYQDLGLRSGSDLDLLIKSSGDLKNIDRILKGLGYFAPFAIPDFSRISINCYRNSLLYHNRDTSKIPLHIYWHPVNVVNHSSQVIASFSSEKLWHNATGINLGGVRLKTFCPRHQIIYLSLHALTHNYSPLILLCDLNELLALNRDSFDWEELVKDAFSFRLNRQVFYALYLAKEILGANMPFGILEKLQDGNLSHFEHNMLSLVIAGKNTLGQEWLTYLSLNKSLKGKVYFLLRALLPSRVEMSLIRQKELSRITLSDYLFRFYSALGCFFKFLQLFLFQTVKCNIF